VSRSIARRARMPAGRLGCRGLIAADHGIGERRAAPILAKLGDLGRSDSRDPARDAGMEITVYRSDRHRSPGHLSRQGPPARGAVGGGAGRATPGRPRSRQLPAGRAPGRQPRPSGARAQAAQRCDHTLPELGHDALKPPAEQRPGTGAARRPASGSLSTLARSATNQHPDDPAA
jgi:hypothetical protein